MQDSTPIESPLGASLEAIIKQLGDSLPQLDRLRSGVESLARGLPYDHPLVIAFVAIDKQINLVSKARTILRNLQEMGWPNLPEFPIDNAIALETLKRWESENLALQSITFADPPARITAVVGETRPIEPE